MYQHVLSAVHRLTHFILLESPWVEADNIPIAQIRKLRPEKLE